MNVIQHLAARLIPKARGLTFGPIGIDLSLTRIHLVQLKKNQEEDVIVHAHASLDYPGTREEILADPLKLKRLVLQVLKQGRFEGRKAVVAMPSGSFRTVSLNYRPNSQISDDKAVSQLMEDRLDQPLSDYVMDYVPVRSDSRDVEKLVIVAASPREKVIQFLESMRSAGLFVEALEISPVAIRRLTNALPMSTSDMVLILNTGVERSYLTMLSGRRLLLDQPIEFCEEKLLDTLAKNLDISQDDARKMVFKRNTSDRRGLEIENDDGEQAEMYNTILSILKPEFLRLVEETDRAFMYASAQTRGGGSAKIYLFGSLARWHGVDRVIADMTHLQVARLPNPLEPFGTADQFLGSNGAMAEPEFAVAAGLALKGLSQDE